MVSKETLIEMRKEFTRNRVNEVLGVSISRGLVVRQEKKGNVRSYLFNFSSGTYDDLSKYDLNEISQEDYNVIFEYFAENIDMSEMIPLWEGLEALYKRTKPLEYGIMQNIKYLYSSSVSTIISFYDKITMKFWIEVNPVFILVFSFIHNISKLESLNMLVQHELWHIIKMHHKKGIDLRLSQEDSNLAYDLFINNDLYREFNHELKIGVFRYCKFSGELKEKVSAVDIVDILKRYNIASLFEGSCRGVYYTGNVEFVYIQKHNITRFGSHRYTEFDVAQLFMELRSLFKECVQNKEAGFGDFVSEVSSETIEAVVTLIESSIKEAKSLISSSKGETLSSHVVSEFEDKVEEIESEIVRPLKGLESNVNWKAVLKRYVVKGLSSEERYDVNRPNSRIEGQFGSDIDVSVPKRIAFAFDVSGSMGVDKYQEALNEIEKIVRSLRIKNIKIDIIWWGSSCRRESFNSYKSFKDRIEKRTPSLGGTDANIPIRELNKMEREDLRFILTDGMFNKPREVSKKRVIWYILRDGDVSKVPKNSKNIIVHPEDKK